MSRYISKLIPQCIFDARLAAHVEDASVRDFTAAALMQTQRATYYFLGAQTHTSELRTNECGITSKAKKTKSRGASTMWLDEVKEGHAKAESDVVKQGASYVLS